VERSIMELHVLTGSPSNLMFKVDLMVSIKEYSIFASSATNKSDNFPAESTIKTAGLFKPFIYSCKRQIRWYLSM
jgi:hypothetical protein